MHRAAPRIWDISRTISTATAVWPGDAAFGLRHAVRIADGAGYNLTTVTMSPHTGTHADAPWHFERDGLHPAQLPLAPYLGRAHVVTVARERGGIVPADLEGARLDGLERLLIHTRASDGEDHQWPAEFAHATVELADWLAARGALLLGLDSPSMDAFDSRELPCHRRLAALGVATIENLRLAGVPDGVYELSALPLKLADTCGSPVRAVLRSLDNAAPQG
jgi:arylformamidase